MRKRRVTCKQIWETGFPSSVSPVNYLRRTETPYAHAILQIIGGKTPCYFFLNPLAGFPAKIVCRSSKVRGGQDETNRSLVRLLLFVILSLSIEPGPGVFAQHSVVLCLISAKGCPRHIIGNVLQFQLQPITRNETNPYQFPLEFCTMWLKHSTIINSARKKDKSLMKIYKSGKMNQRFTPTLVAGNHRFCIHPGQTQLLPPLLLLLISAPSLTPGPNLLIV